MLISLYPDQREWLAGQENRAAAIRAAIDEKIQREGKITVPARNKQYNQSMPGYPGEEEL